jgi:UDP:flavonoid glycosyltransferase YjiC (YdhE family)
MRVLFSNLAGSGHFHPLVPTARALQQAGHEVAFATPEESHEAVKASGFQVFAAGIGFQELLSQRMGLSPEQMLARQVEMANLSPEQRMGAMGAMVGMFVEGFTTPRLPQMVAVCEQWRPQLIVRESMECSAVLVGEKLGIPQASIQVGGMLMDAGNPKLFAQHMDGVRESFGLKADPELKQLYPHLHLSFMPRSYFAQPLPPTTRYLRADVFDKSGSEGLPDWVSKLGGRPIIYATLGTAFNKLSNHLRTIADGLENEDVELIITVGRDVDPAVLGPRPANVHVERYIPQSMLLPRCAVAILHGGYSSVMSALYAGVPSLILPLGADQPINAEASQRIGTARTLRPDSLTPELVRQQVREVLADNAMRERVRRMRDEIQAQPGVEHGVALLEQLARDKTLPAAS